MSKYGPHREDDAPNAVVVLGAGKWPRPDVQPIPEALRRQRATINRLAHERKDDGNE